LDAHLVTDMAELEAIYHPVNPTSLLKEIDHISDDYRKHIEASPFLVLATVGPEGLDCSPRGDPAGFVQVPDSRTLLIPDRRGNNRVDSLRNILRDPRVALLFMTPGVGTTMRVNGRAAISTDPALRARFVMQGKEPATVIVVTAERVYPQCQKAIARSRLWHPDSHRSPDSLPSIGQMMQRLDAGFDGATYDANYPERMRQTIY
jgi:PPOX class probable FMN-dependent enzyme